MKYSLSYYRPQNWPKYTLEVSKEGSLKDIFDAGLRPYYWPNTQGDTLEFKHANLTLVTSEGVKLPMFSTEYSKIEIQPAGILALTLIGQSLTVEEAYHEMSQWLSFIGKSEDHLERFLEAVESDPVGFDDQNFGTAPEGFSGGWIDGNKVGYGVRFQKAYNPVVPVRIYLTVGWSRLRTKAERRNFYHKPVSPPEGYEEYVIESRDDFGPDDTAEMMHAKGIRFPSGMSLTGAAGKVIESAKDVRKSNRPEPLLPSNNVDKRVNEAGENSPILWAIMCILLLGVCVFLISGIRRAARSLLRKF